MGLEPSFQISILASGSTGNTLYIETAKKKLLVDAGLSGKKVTELLKQVGKDPAELDGILVTHEHRDHIHGVGVLARRYHLPVYANEKTWEAMSPLIGEIPLEQKEVFDMGTVKTFGDLDIESFGVSHDAAAPQFYRFYSQNKSFVVLTDTGYCSEAIKGVVKNADAYLIETNHEVEMLYQGSYPWNLKQRILGDKGHLSNTDGALVMADILGDRTKKIFLGHLSEENNTKYNARMAMESILSEKGFGVNETFKIYDTDPKIPTNLFSV